MHRITYFQELLIQLQGHVHSPSFHFRQVYRQADKKGHTQSQTGRQQEQQAGMQTGRQTGRQAHSLTQIPRSFPMGS